MVIITGPGRSGTSVLALFCQKMDYDPGGNWYDAVDAGLEHANIVKINDALLREARQTGATRKAVEVYGEEMRQIDLPVIKDPRFTYHPAVLYAWRSVREDLKFLVTYRIPEECIASRQRRARFLTERRSRKPDILRCQIADSIETLLALDIPFQLLLFPKFLTQFDLTLGAFQKLGLNMDRQRAEKVWADVVDLNKVHIGSPFASEVHREHCSHPRET